MELSFHQVASRRMCFILYMDDCISLYESEETINPKFWAEFGKIHGHFPAIHTIGCQCHDIAMELLQLLYISSLVFYFIYIFLIILHFLLLFLSFCLL